MKVNLYFEDDKAYFAYPRLNTSAQQEPPQFLLLIMPSKDLLPAGVTHQKMNAHSKLFRVAEYDGLLYFTPLLPLPAQDFIEKYVFTLLWIVGAICIFLIFGFWDRKFVQKKAFEDFKEENFNLQSLTESNGKLLKENAKLIQKQQSELKAIQISTEAQGQFRERYESRLNLIQERFEKKLRILSTDLEQFSLDDPALQNLYEISSTALKDFSVLALKSPLNTNRVQINMEKEVERVLKIFAHDLYKKQITPACLVESEAAFVHGDIDTLRLILLTSLKSAVDRLSAKGELDIHIKPNETVIGKVDIDIMDNGYHFEESEISPYNIKKKPKQSLLNMHWYSFVQILESYGGAVLKQENAPHNNTLSFSIPIDIAAKTPVSTIGNIVSLFKS